nr:MAG TPA: hypothetical protein [Caudoviricetes sp.]
MRFKRRKLFSHEPLQKPPKPQSTPHSLGDYFSVSS